MSDLISFSFELCQGLCVGDWPLNVGSAGQEISSELHDFDVGVIGLIIRVSIVDAKAILNNLSTNCSPLTHSTQFFITASPRVFGGEIRGFGNRPCHGIIEFFGAPLLKLIFAMELTRGNCQHKEWERNY
jgi:hypothetical protein